MDRWDHYFLVENNEPPIIIIKNKNQIYSLKCGSKDASKDYACFFPLLYEYTYFYKSVLRYSRISNPGGSSDLSN